MSVRVLLCDHQSIWRAGLRAILTEQPDIHVVGEAADGATAVALARRHTPDLVIMELRLPELDGVQATLQLAGPAARPPVNVVILTLDNDDHDALAALRAGAIGFLRKDLPGHTLVDAVRLAATGGMVLAPELTSRLHARMARLPTAASAQPSVLDRLTPREREVLGLVAQGRANPQIATALRLGEGTVRSHVAHLQAKLGVHDRAQLVVLAYETGLVRPSHTEPATGSSAGTRFDARAAGSDSRADSGMVS